MGFIRKKKKPEQSDRVNRKKKPEQSDRVDRKKEPIERKTTSKKPNPKWKKKPRKPPRMKPCPGCYTDKEKKFHPGVCKVCKGTGETRIIQSRNKGANFERIIAKTLTTWTGTTIARSPASGGRSKKSGDITPKDPKEMVRHPFGWEMKNNETWSLPSLFESSELPKTFASYWKQCTEDAARGGKIPLLVFTQNNLPIFIMMERKTFIDTRLKRYVIENDLSYMKIGLLRVTLFKHLLAIPYKNVLELIGDQR